MEQHLVEYDLARVFHAQGDHGQAVPDQDDVHAGGIGDVGAGEVVGRDHGDRLTPLVHGPERPDRDPLPRIGQRRPHRGVGAVPSLLEGREQRTNSEVRRSCAPRQGRTRPCQ